MLKYSLLTRTVIIKWISKVFRTLIVALKRYFLKDLFTLVHIDSLYNGAQLKSHGGPKISLNNIQGPKTICFTPSKGVSIKKNKVKEQKNKAARAKLKASMLCMPGQDSPCTNQTVHTEAV